MKKIFILAIAAGLAFTSCEDMLDTTNYTKANTSNFPSRPVDMDQEINALYAVMNQIQLNPLQFPYFMNDIMSDDCNGAGGVGDAEVKALSHMTLYSNTQFDEAWKLTYRGIYRANTIIETVDNCRWGGDTKARNQALGEGFYMRALFALWATQLWGNIPFPTTTAVPDPCPEVDAETVIYPQIISDLVSASNLMSNDKYGTYKDGHASKWAAEALLARAYMFYEGFYKKHFDLATASPEAVTLNAQEGITEGQTLSKDDVAKALKDIIDNGGYSLVPDFRCLWQYTNELTVEDYNYTKDQNLKWAGNGNSEEIFQIQFMNSSSWSSPEYAMAYANESSLYCGLRCDNDKEGNVNGLEATFPFGRGWGQGVASSNFWNDWSKQEQADGEEDIRKTASILDCQKELTKYAFVINDCEDAGYCMKKLLPVTCKQSADGKKVNDWSSISTWWDYVSGNKGCSNGEPLQGSHYADIYLIRLADVYLMHSELTGDATYMNKVRARAGLSSKTYSLENIQNERRWELSFEGLRFNDLRRWSGINCGNDAIVCKALDGQAGQTMYVRGELSKTPLKHMTSSWTQRYTETNGFIPKPVSQISLANGALTQNKGWDTSDAKYVEIY